MSCIREKGLLDPMDIVIEPPFINEVMEQPKNDKLKPPLINPYDGTKDLEDYVQTFWSHMHNVDAPDAIIYQDFFIIFHLATRDQYATLNPNSIGSFKVFTYKLISHFVSSCKTKKTIVNLLGMQYKKKKKNR